MVFTSINLKSRWLVSLFFLFSWITPDVVAESISLTSSQDNTLFEFDPSDMDSPFNSNGAGDFISAGRTRSRGLIRRGLLQFDFSAIPAGAVVLPGTVQLALEVVDSPSRDESGEARDFWLLPVEQRWGEGSSEANAGISGSGSGAPATPGDATWLHTEYDPTIHDPRNPNPADENGYWMQVGILGDAAVDPTVFGDPSGTVPAAPYLGPVTFTSAAMETDINAWLADPASNFGWLIVGDERIADADRSSARGFASREHSTPPTLTFEYRIEEFLGGDFDQDGDVDGNDFLTWQASFGVDAGGDADNDGDTDGDDFLIWQSQFGSGSGSASAAAPEPSSIALLILALVSAALLPRRYHPG